MEAQSKPQLSGFSSIVKEASLMLSEAGKVDMSWHSEERLRLILLGEVGDYSTCYKELRIRTTL